MVDRKASGQPDEIMNFLKFSVRIFMALTKEEYYYTITNVFLSVSWVKCMLNKNTLGVKKCEANLKQHARRQPDQKL